MKKLFTDTGFLTWIVVMALPFIAAGIDHVAPAMYATGFLAVATGSMLGFWILCRQYSTILQFRLQFSLLQLVLATMGLGIEIGLAIAFVKFNGPHGSVVLFMALLFVPVFSAACIGAVKTNYKHNEE